MRLQHALGRGWEFSQLFGGPYRPTHQLTAAIGTAPARKALLRAFSAKRALERADERVGRIGGQILIATFAVGSQFKHRPSFSRCWR
jgi:hypothetical protein